MVLGKVDSKENVADLGTKILDNERVRVLSRRCGLGLRSELLGVLQALIFTLLFRTGRTKIE